MSATFEIACEDCRVKAWVGQATTTGRKYLYRDATLDRFEAFLFAHEGHRLVFASEAVRALYDFADAFPDDD